jgi:ABC-type proline/glycine betaine transport system substrate-binding protein
MKNDPVLDKIRETRHLISAQCQHDPKKLVAYYLQRQKEREKKWVDYKADTKVASA